MGVRENEELSALTADCRMWVDDPAGFTTHKVGRLHHDYHRHPLFQLPELEALAKELMPLKQCRFVRPGLTQASAFAAIMREISIVCGWRSPDSRATGMPYLSLTTGSSVTRESGTGISCVGPITTRERL